MQTQHHLRVTQGRTESRHNTKAMDAVAGGARQADTSRFCRTTPPMCRHKHALFIASRRQGCHMCCVTTPALVCAHASRCTVHDHSSVKEGVPSQCTHGVHLLELLSCNLQRWPLQNLQNLGRTTVLTHTTSEITKGRPCTAHYFWDLLLQTSLQTPPLPTPPPPESVAPRGLVGQDNMHGTAEHLGVSRQTH